MLIIKYQMLKVKHLTLYKQEIEKRREFLPRLQKIEPWKIDLFFFSSKWPLPRNAQVVQWILIDDDIYF